MKLTAEHVSKSFGDQPVLTDINFSIQSGETLAIAGRSGCGENHPASHSGGLFIARQRQRYAGRSHKLAAAQG